MIGRPRWTPVISASDEPSQKLLAQITRHVDYVCVFLATQSIDETRKQQRLLQPKVTNGAHGKAARDGLVDMGVARKYLSYLWPGQDIDLRCRKAMRNRFYQGSADDSVPEIAGLDEQHPALIFG
jgi:hypothetical protein